MPDFTIARLTNKPDQEEALARIDAWFRQEVIDRPPIRFTGHNTEHNVAPLKKFEPTARWKTLKDRWFDAEYQVDSFIASIWNKRFLAETFPVFMPNLGPEVYSAFYGCELIYQEITSYCVPKVRAWSDMDQLVFDRQNEYFLKIEEMTRLALEKCEGSYWVGYTDLHPGGDCAAAWRDPQQFCMDLVHEPDHVKTLVTKASYDFLNIYDYFDNILKKHAQPSITWMGIPSSGRMHIPSCDFSSMISSRYFEEYFLPAIQKEVGTMTHNIFHLDGKGVARHLDLLLELPEIHAIQWVQGLGKDQPILQWLPLIRKILDAGKSVLLEIKPEELKPLLRDVGTKGLMLSMGGGQDIQENVIDFLMRSK